MNTLQRRLQAVFFGALLLAGAGCSDDAEESGGTNSANGGSSGTGGANGGSGGTSMGGSTSGASGTSAGGTTSGGGTSGSSGASGSSGTGGGPSLPTDPSGFTILTPSADTRTIYVSSSMGSDSNDGLSEAEPVQSIEAGIEKLRDGFPDWLLFKRGDVWDEGLGQWVLSGRSPTERMVIGAYGEGERPRLDGDGISTTGAGGSPESMDNLVFVSLHLHGAAHDPTMGTPSGANPHCVSWLRGARNVLFEDMRFQYCQVTFDEFDDFPIDGVRIFRSLFLDSFSVDDAHAQGLYVNWVSNFSVEENVFDYCGWHPDVSQADPTMFNHCIYWQSGSDNTGVVRGNIIMRGSSHGAQMRSSGTVVGNVFIRNAIGGFHAGDYEPVPTGRRGSLIGNVFTEAEDITPRENHPGTDLRGWGWEFVEGANGIRSLDVTDNIFTHCGAGACGTMASSLEDSTIENNVVWDWTSTPGEIQESDGPFADPDRTIASYSASLGGDETFEAFADEVRNQSKTNWRPAYGAEAIIQYFREGFEEP